MVDFPIWKDEVVAKRCYDIFKMHKARLVDLTSWEKKFIKEVIESYLSDGLDFSDVSFTVKQREKCEELIERYWPK